MSEHPDPLRTAPEGDGRLVAPAPARAALPPAQIGRYRVERLLGEGSFGRVFLARDEQLRRLVAVKAPHAHLIASPQDADAYLAEARTAAGLDHPHIVPVFDVGGTPDFPCFIVSKFIEGRTLAWAIRHDRPAPAAAAALVASVADALQHAHQRGVVHRDVKPGNILLDAAGRPFVADFGLALRDQDAGHGPRYAGTPAYMSPEQARGEGHRVDGRTDVFSLGVVFYELLTGRRPFHADSREELLEQITSFEPRPPRQQDDSIPKELERICLKALSKRASERYTTAKDMADDLRHFLNAQAAATSPVAAVGVAGTPTGMPAPATPTPTAPGASGELSASRTAPPSDGTALKVIPKGLRSFDAHDADFFLELLPGPRDREGLPDGIRFWKTRIEETDPDGAFAVGLIYGPSGCGKSSLVRAGLLPRLSDDVIAVYVEATARETEPRLLNGLRKRCPALPAQLGLKEALAALRRGQGVPAGKKVLIVLDQFEQWLHAKKEERSTELVQALRQCDGGRVQCVVMVRDDFWMAATRFMRELEIRLVEAQNSAAVDLFDPDHARKVLAAFGRAFGKLPENSGETSKDQKTFLNEAVSGLAQEGKIICVRLALFAEMMKGKAWTPATLKEVGGAEGVGVTFLEETFSAATAPPEHRYHQKAARAVLKALLPESGADIKGHMRSHAELLQASGYANRPKDFDDLLRILDGEIRLLTPTDPEGEEAAEVAAFARTRENPDVAANPHSGECGYTRFYQLTHDYLVPLLRDWLTRKQKETRRGRAELLLADRAAVWNARPENRQLPSLSQWFRIRWLTAKKHWTPPQRKMMGRAARHHGVRAAVLAVLLTAGAVAGLAVWNQVVERHNEDRAAGLVDQLRDADIGQVQDIIRAMGPYRRWADPRLREAYAEAKSKGDARQRLRLSLGLLPADPGQVDYLYGSLLAAEAPEVGVIVQELSGHKDELIDRLWTVAEKPETDPEGRLRAAAALAAYDPDSPRWNAAAPSVVGGLVSVNPIFSDDWMKALRPVRDKLQGPLEGVFRDHKEDRANERSLATNILAVYAADKPEVLADLLMDADEKQFAVIYPKFKEQGEQGLPVLTGEIDKKLPSDLPSSDEKREKLAKRQANAAVALLRMNQVEKVWPQLMRRDQPGKPDDPRLRSYLIHRFGPLGADARVLVKRLAEEPDVTIRRALILSLGPEEFEGEPGGVGPRSPLPPEEKKLLVERLRELYRTASDPGLRAAAEWLLRQWQEEAWLAQTDEAAAKDKEGREKRLTDIQQELAKEKDKAQPRWYVNGQGQTMVVIPGPVEFLMGSPTTEAGRGDYETQHKERIGRTFVLAANSVTVEQYRQFDKGYKLPAVFTRTADLPVVGPSWYQAAAYCNWLSKEEGIPEGQWCYEIKGNMVKLKEKYLSLTGYRLPTEAEMEFATRAGALTSRYFGETEDLLPKYAWYLKNSQEKTWPVGSLKPNDLGLFDVEGNVDTWCQESYKAYPASKDEEAYEDKEDVLSIDTSKIRVLRGGSFFYQASNVRSANRFSNAPANRVDGDGFRPARTFIP